MRRHALPLLLCLLLPALPASARGQDTIPRAEALRRLPPGEAQRECAAGARKDMAIAPRHAVAAVLAGDQ